MQEPALRQSCSSILGDRWTNLADVVSDGSQKGENNAASKLSNLQADSARWLRAEGYSLADLAIIFDCASTIIGNICTGKTRQSSNPEAAKLITRRKKCSQP